MTSRLPHACPDQPGFKVSGPSEQAATAIASTANTLRNQVLNTIAAAPMRLTADEVAAKLNKSVLSVRPRVAELYKQGEIRQTGTQDKNVSGMTATVWALSPLLATWGGQR